MNGLKKGDRIELISMEDDPDPFAPGARGTVKFVARIDSHFSQVDVDWDNGRTLALSFPPDQVKILS